MTASPQRPGGGFTMRATATPGGDLVVNSVEHHKSGHTPLDVARWNEREWRRRHDELAARIPVLLAEHREVIRRVAALAGARRKTVPTADLRAALGWGEQT